RAAEALERTPQRLDEEEEWDRGNDQGDREPLEESHPCGPEELTFVDEREQIEIRAAHHGRGGNEGAPAERRLAQKRLAGAVLREEDVPSRVRCERRGLWRIDDGARAGGKYGIDLETHPGARSEGRVAGEIDRAEKDAAEASASHHGGSHVDERIAFPL